MSSTIKAKEKCDISSINESSDLVKTFVPDFQLFQEDPDKWLSQLDGYGDTAQSEFGEDPQEEAESFESGQADVQVQNDGGSDAGSDFGNEPTGGEFGNDASSEVGDVGDETQVEGDEFAQGGDAAQEGGEETPLGDEAQAPVQGEEGTQEEAPAQEEGDAPAQEEGDAPAQEEDEIF